MLFSCHILRSVILISSAACMMCAAASDRSGELVFAMPTTDGRSHVGGVIDLPDVRHTRGEIAVLMVGGAFATRDGAAFADRSAPRFAESYWWRSLGEVLRKHGYVVARFDTHRGIRSLLTCEVFNGRPLDLNAYLGDQRCYDSAEAGSTTFQTKRDDLAQVYRRIKQDPALRIRSVIVLAQSEAAFHVAALMQDQRIRPDGLVWLSAAAGSARALAHWQSVTRQEAWIRRLLLQRRTSLSNADVRELFGELREQYRRVEPMLSPSGAWTAANLPQLTRQLEDQYQKDLVALMAHPATEPFVDTFVPHVIRLPVAAYGYQQAFATESLDVMDALALFRGPSVFIYGQDDTILPVSDYINAIRDRNPSRALWRLSILEKCQHDLTGPDGKLIPGVLERVADEVDSTARQLSPLQE